MREMKVYIFKDQISAVSLNKFMSDNNHNDYSIISNNNFIAVISKKDLNAFKKLTDIQIKDFINYFVKIDNLEIKMNKNRRRSSKVMPELAYLKNNSLTVYHRTNEEEKFKVILDWSGFKEI